MYRAAFPSQWLLAQMMTTHGNAPPPYPVTFYNGGSDIYPLMSLDPMMSNSSALLPTPSPLEIANTADYTLKKPTVWSRKGNPSTKSVSTSSKTFHGCAGHGGRYRAIPYQNGEYDGSVHRKVDKSFDRPLPPRSSTANSHSYNKGSLWSSATCDMNNKGIKRQLDASGTSARSSRSPSPNGGGETSRIPAKKKYQAAQPVQDKNDSKDTPAKPAVEGSGMLQHAMIPKDLFKGNEWDKLSSDIWAKFLCNRQTDETYDRKLRLREVLYHIVKGQFPGCGLYIVGSSMNGFGCDTSDIDMCLMLQHNDMDQKIDAINILKLIQTTFNRCDFLQKVELIRAKVPILKFTDTVSGVEVDLNVNNSVGIRNTHLLHNYSNLDWRVRPLVIVAKLWARAFDINDAKNMTISSYSLALMVIHYLQYGVTPSVLPCLQKLFPLKFMSDSNIRLLFLDEVVHIAPSLNNQSLGELFLGFLHYYTTVFQYEEEAISVRLGRRVPKQHCQYQRARKNNSGQWKLLCIEEPFDLTNTARSVYDDSVFDRVKDVFKNSYEKVQRCKSLSCILNS